MKKRLTEQRLYNIALYYLSKYEASEKKVADMLSRRILNAKRRGDDVPENASAFITPVLEKLKSQNFLSDARYAENRVYQLSQQGKSRKSIALKLKMAGIDNDMADTLLDETDEDDLPKAIRYVERKKLGFMRPEQDRRDNRQKDLARLARQGFSLDTAKKALDGDAD